MCGLAYSQSFDGTAVNDSIVDQYIRQIGRGTEGFGLFNGKHIVKAAKEERIVRWLEKKKNQSDLILFHHRWPTSTINCRKAAHPFTTKDYFGDTQYVLIHNGTVDNAKELYVAHQELGIEYQSLLDDMTFNDSEALLWDLALTLEGKQEKLAAYGGIAFICMKMVAGEPERLYFGRNSSKPLNLLRNKQQMFLSSEGEGEEIKPAMLYNYNYKLKRLTSRVFAIPIWERSYSWDQTRAHYLPAPSVTTYGSVSYDHDSWGDGDWSREFSEYDGVYRKYAERFNEIYAAGGVYWQDEYGEEYFDAYNTAPMYYRRQNSAELVKDILRSREYSSIRLLNKNPTEEQVDETIRSYTAEAYGDATTAFWNMEIDYEKIEGEPLGLDRTQKLELLQRAINKIESVEDLDSILEVI